MKIKIDLFQSFLINPFPVFSDENSNRIEKEFKNSMSALKNIDKIDLQIADVSSAEMMLTQVKRKSPDLKKFWAKNENDGKNELLYKFSVSVFFKPQYYQELEKLKIDSNIFFTERLLPDLIEKRFYEFLMILHICKIGGIRFGMGCIKKDGEYVKLKSLNLYNLEIFEHSIEKKWPKFENLEIIKTWNWYLYKVNPKGVDEISSTSLSRAFNAFSYLYEESEYINKLFWTMVGLEAIYVEGNEGISKQIKHKGQLFLGEIGEFKKRLSTMYSFRSAFIHGSKDFPSYFHTHDGIESFANFNEEIYEVVLTAQSMLIATLQKMAKQNINELKFKYIINRIR